ncbi:MAG TPA: tol-pal system protein YbgF [Polyangia bacterium]|jgi:tol-pal system protein YbgF
MSKLGRIFASGALVAPLLIGGCADSTSSAQLADLSKRLDAETRRTAASEHKIDELENRVFLLTDQVESQKVAAIRRSKQPLPIVTLKPDAPPEEAPSDGSEEIVFEGAARSSDPAHTVIRIDGTRVVSHREGRGEAKIEPRSEPRFSDADIGVRDQENLGVAPVPSIHPNEHAPPAAEPLALYKSAYDDLRAGKHEAAEHGFREFVKKYPHHDYADNAQYWLGECFYDQRAFDKAAPEFRAVVQRWPSGNKAPDAMLKLGFSLLALGDVDKGRATLRAVDTTYPHTEAARLASERLAQLNPTEVPK